MYNVTIESSLDVCSRRRTRCTVTTPPDDGTRLTQLQPALSSAGTDKVGLEQGRSQGWAWGAEAPPPKRNPSPSPK